MKKLMISAFAITGIIVICSCDSITTDFDTNLNKTIVSEIEQPQAKALTKNQTTYPFSSADVLDIRDNSKINDYIDRLKEIDVKSITCTFTGIPEGESITELNISLGTTGLEVNLSDITNQTQITLDVSHQFLNDISTQLVDNHELIIAISGESTFAPMTLNTFMSFAVTVTARVLD